MAPQKVRLTQLNVVPRDFEATARFWRTVGLEVPEPTRQPPGTLHAEIDAGGVRLGLDSESLARWYNAGARRGELGARAVFGLTVESREAVDETYERLVQAGFEGRQRPYDAFWGSRYAIVADPDGHDVGLMSEPDAARASWPPVESPNS
jgi:uncharacterized glyoxalase superfamily protein PhnB